MELFSAANVLLRLVGIAAATTVVPVEQIPEPRKDVSVTVWIDHGWKWWLKVMVTVNDGDGVHAVRIDQVSLPSTSNS